MFQLIKALIYSILLVILPYFVGRMVQATDNSGVDLGLSIILSGAFPLIMYGWVSTVFSSMTVDWRIRRYLKK